MARGNWHLWRLVILGFMLVLDSTPVSAQPTGSDSTGRNSQRFPVPMVVAHRGLLQIAPENTLVNFNACLRRGMGFELDVRRSKDGHLVCVHDATVNRTTNGKGPVAELTLAELKKLDAGSWFHPTFKDARVPTLDEVFQMVGRRQGASRVIAIDLKADEVAADVVKLAVRRGVLNQLLFIGTAIRDPKVRTEIRRANKNAHVACVANSAAEFEEAVTAKNADWIYFRYVPNCSEMKRVHATGRRAFIAGPTVAKAQRRNWTIASYVGMDAVLTDDARTLKGQFDQQRRLQNEYRAIPKASYVELAVGDSKSGEYAKSAGMEPGKLAMAADLIAKRVKDGTLPGAVILVARRGKVVLHRAFGHRDLARSKAMKKDSLFRMASNSKAVTAVGILDLVQRGILDLDAPVGDYLPAFRNRSYRDVTLRQLLTHTSGIRIRTLFLRPLLEKSIAEPNDDQLIAEVERFAKVAPEVKPASSYAYNNPGYNILAAIIQHATGSYQRHLRDRVYEKLGMSDSCNHESVANHDRMSSILRRQPDGSWKAGWKPGDDPDYPFPRGSGGMVSTAMDYARFCHMLLRQGAGRDGLVIHPDLVKSATNPQGGLIPAAKHYGFGWQVGAPGTVFMHGGSDGTWAFVDPQRDLIGILFTQAQRTKIPREEFLRLILAAALK